MPRYDQMPDLPEIDFSMFAENRAKFVKGMAGQQGVLLISGGQSKELYDTDREVLFRQESNFYYLFGCEAPDCHGAIDVATGKAVLVVPELDEAHAVWLGSVLSKAEWKAQHQVDEVVYTHELEKWVQTHYAGKPVHILDGVNSDSKSHVAHPHLPWVAALNPVTAVAYPVLAECRVLKTEKELRLLRYVNKVSSAAHVEVMQQCRPGIGEFQLESLFLHSVYAKGMCRHVCYTCICASGCSGAVLHYPNNDKMVGSSAMMLMDMGAEYHCYCSDITCSYPSNGKFTEDQKLIYNAVLEANLAVQRAMKPGVSWTAMHELSYIVMAEHMLKIGIFKAGHTAREIVDCDLMGLFMPHGLGHLLGLNVHDVGGYLEGNPSRSQRPGFRSLRTARNLEAGMVITVEPGLYFSKVLITSALADPEKAKYLNSDVLLRFMEFGGVRIEDDVLVTATGSENLTIVPRTVEEIEAVMAGGEWPLGKWF